MSPMLADIQLPTDGIPIEQPKETNPPDTISSPVIIDKDLSFLEQKVKSQTEAGSGEQNTITMFGTAIKIDGPNKRIIINDGTNDRIIIGFYDV